MRASEWQYLCAVHDPPKSCCAIDYCCHTLDWAANTLTSPKHFPSRLAFGTEGAQQGHGVTRQHQERHLTNIFRRVYRIFAHAWFCHREVFWRVETRTGLYTLFKIVCDVYGLIEKENYTIPPEAEGLEPNEGTKDTTDDPSAATPSSILQRGGGSLDSYTETSETPNYSSNNNNGVGATARRHRSHLSKSSTVVGTVLEENEDEPDLDQPSHPPISSQADTTQEPVSPQMAETDVPRTASPTNVDASAILMKGDFELGHEGEGPDTVLPLMELSPSLVGESGRVSPGKRTSVDVEEAQKNEPGPVIGEDASAGKPAGAGGDVASVRRED